MEVRPACEYNFVACIDHWLTDVPEVIISQN